MSIEKKEKLFSRKGFSLIELLIAMFIFMMIMGAMVAVSVAGFRSYAKSKATKTVSEDVGFAINSVTKDVRMGKIETDSSKSNTLEITRNRDQIKVCYQIAPTTLGICESACDSCSSSDYKNLVDLSGTNMLFDGTSGFRNKKTDTISATKLRGWAEINLNIENYSMESDSIRVQTIVSSRDYGWEK